MSSKTTTLQHFAEVPQAEIQRSKFKRSNGLKTTLNAGQLVPIFLDEVLPGDTMHLKDHLFGRLSTPITPFMDNLHLDTHYFFVPSRLLWTNFPKFMGEQNNPGDSTDYIMPQMTSTAVTGYDSLSVFDHFGIPTKVPGLEHSCLPLRAYNKIWNTWYRDENLQNSVVENMGDGPDAPSDYTLLKRGKRKDYFSGSLPFAQKGPAVNLPLGTSAPVLGIGKTNNNFATGPITVNESDATSSSYAKYQYVGDSTADRFFVIEGQTVGGANFPHVWADLTLATAATINSLRLAFQVQRMYERDARGGTRYVEIIKAHFNVTSPDFRLQRPEFLGANTKQITSTVVAQTSSTDATTPQANLSAFSTVSDSGSGFNHSFTEHGYIIGLCSLRADLNYQQGLNRLWSRRTRFDLFWPALSHLGEQAILNKEIYAQGSVAPTVDASVFGYQERHAEYRYKPNEIHGAFRSNYTGTLDIWHLAQNFTSLPLLNASFIEENPPVPRILAVPDEPHLILDIWFDYESDRPMPTYAVPGLVDHF